MEQSSSCSVCIRHACCKLDSLSVNCVLNLELFHCVRVFGELYEDRDNVEEVTDKCVRDKRFCINVFRREFCELGA